MILVSTFYHEQDALVPALESSYQFLRALLRPVGRLSALGEKSEPSAAL